MTKGKRILIVSVALVLLVAIAVAVYFLITEIKEAREERELERLVKEYYDAKLAQYREENERYADYEVDVAFLGDSLTDGYDLASYYPQYVTANRGIGGERTHGLLERLPVSVYELKPKVVVMLIGGNNLDTMLDDYESILIGLRDNLPHTKVILVSLTSMGGKFAEKNKIAAYNNVVIKKLAEEYGYRFVDLYTPLFDTDSGEIYREYTSDGAHLTHKGYEVFTEVLTPAIDAALRQR